jgi:hypothetical protein
MEPCLMQITQYFGAGSALMGVIAAAAPARVTLATMLHEAWSRLRDLG